jgi:hypothetical protein
LVIGWCARSLKSMIASGDDRTPQSGRALFRRREPQDPLAVGSSMRERRGHVADDFVGVANRNAVPEHCPSMPDMVSFFSWG